jgi:pimeloyl-ACP methyl ester carboxylesterase
VERNGNLGWEFAGRFVSVPPVTTLPPGNMCERAGRGSTFVVVPVGYSMGAQVVARRHPDRVAGVVLGAATTRLRRGTALSAG